MWPLQPCTFTSQVHDSENNDLRWRSLALEKDDSSHLLSTTKRKLQTLMIQCSNFSTASGRSFLVLLCVFFSLSDFLSECWLTINLLYRQQATSYLSEDFKILVYGALHGFRAKCIDSSPQVLWGGRFTHWLWNQGWAAWNCILASFFFGSLSVGPAHLRSAWTFSWNLPQKKIYFCCGSSLNECFFLLSPACI